MKKQKGKNTKQSRVKEIGSPGGKWGQTVELNKVGTWGLIEKGRFMYMWVLLNAKKNNNHYSYSTSMSLAGDVLAIIGFVMKKKKSFT